MLGARPQNRSLPLTGGLELDDAEVFEFLQVPVDLAVVAVDGGRRRTDAVGLVRDDRLDQLEIGRPHETGDVVVGFEVQDEPGALFDCVAALAGLGAFESLAGRVAVLFLLLERDFESVVGYGWS